MVRIKHRYLILRILYPEKGRFVIQNDERLQFFQPTSDALTIPLLLRLIRNSIDELFGDYGSGVVASNLSSMFARSPVLSI